MKPTQPPTHLALPLTVAKAIRRTLGAMPYDQVRDLLGAFDNSPTVSINAPMPDPAPDLASDPEGPEDVKSDQRH